MHLEDCFFRELFCPRRATLCFCRGSLSNYRLVVNPTREEMSRSKLNLVIAGTSDAVLMVEGFCDFLPEETVLEAIRTGYRHLDDYLELCRTLVHGEKREQAEAVPARRWINLSA